MLHSNPLRATCSINTKRCVGESRDMQLNSSEYSKGLDSVCVLPSNASLHVCACAQVNVCLNALTHELVNCVSDGGEAD